MQVTRRIVAILLAVVAAAFAPAALAVRAANSTLFDTGDFVTAAVAVAADDTVREEIVDNFTTSVMDEFLVENIVPAPLLAAAGVSAKEVNDAVAAIVRRAVTTTVASEEFAAAWEQASRAAHESFIAALDADGPGSSVTVDLSSIVREVQARLETGGVVGTLLQLTQIIPDDTSLTVELLDAEQVESARDARDTLSVLSWAAPVAAIVFAALTTIAWPSLRGGALTAGFAFMVGGIGTLVARSQAAGQVESRADDNADIARAVFDVVTERLTTPAVVVAALGAAAVAASFARRQAPGRT
ncbi:MAG: hypothetical protein ACO3RB_05460 [Ilumatobacteraceae bacterium]